MSSITHIITTEIHNIKGFNRFCIFYLIPEDIDGAADTSFRRFANFEEVKRDLPKLIEDMDFFGEWTLSLFQSKDLSVLEQSASNSLRENGLKIFEISYMNFMANARVLITNSLIHFYCEEIEGEEDWEQIDPTINFEISELNITVLLEEEINEVRFPEDDYPGDVDLIYKKYYESP